MPPDLRALARRTDPAEREEQAIKAMAPTGRLMKKIQRHEYSSVIHPPSVGPSTGAMSAATPK